MWRGHGHRRHRTPRESERERERECNSSDRMVAALAKRAIKKLFRSDMYSGERLLG
jgi:hypothetical protein